MRQISALLALVFAGQVQALPQGGQVVSGNAAIHVSCNCKELIVRQSSQNISIDWQSFGIASGQTVRFAQPASSSIALNRVLGHQASEIYGNLIANGQVFLINPNGILFGRGAQVNVGGLVASSNPLSDADFLAGRYRFGGSQRGPSNPSNTSEADISNGGNGGDGGDIADYASKPGTVVNRGNLRATDGGYIALLAPRVRNEGVISARLGSVLLAAGNAVTLTLDNGSLIAYTIERGALMALAENKQLISADGGKVWLAAKAANQITRALVNNDGVIEARTIQNQAGLISLAGDMQKTDLKLAGTLDASAPNGGNGGSIRTSAAKLSIADTAKVYTTAQQGQTGNWEIVQTGNFNIAAGATISGGTLGKNLDQTNITLRSAAPTMPSAATSSATADILLQDSVLWRSSNNLTLNAQGHIGIDASLINHAGTTLVLRADQSGNGVGTVAFGANGQIDLRAGGATHVFYNPSNYNAPTNFAANISGTLTAWMLVNDVKHLQLMNSNLTGNYALGRDIDASATAKWNGGAGFAPVGGSYSTPFSGQFNGLQHDIHGLTIARPNSDAVGLFGYANNTIANLGLLGGDISGYSSVGALVGVNAASISNVSSNTTVHGDSYIGGLVGSNSGAIKQVSHSGTVFGRSQIGGLAGENSGAGQISNASSTGTVLGSEAMIGGLVGRVMGGSIDNVYSNATVSAHGSEYAGAVGGLVGYVDWGNISNAVSSGTVSGVYNVGGLVGVAADSVVNITNARSSATVSGSGGFVGGLVGQYTYGIISNSSASGAVSGGTIVGGLVGSNFNGTIKNAYSTGSVSANTIAGGLVGSNNGNISNTYSSGKVSATSEAGGLIGSNDGSVVYSYWDIAQSGQNGSAGAGASGLSSTQMRQQASFSGFDFVNIWNIDEGHGTPFLRALTK